MNASTGTADGLVKGALGTALFQYHDNEPRIVGHASHVLRDHEKNYMLYLAEIAIFSFWYRTLLQPPNWPETHATY